MSTKVDNPGGMADALRERKENVCLECVMLVKTNSCPL
jgi:hypothetical protein